MRAALTRWKAVGRSALIARVARALTLRRPVGWSAWCRALTLRRPGFRSALTWRARTMRVAVAAGPIARPGAGPIPGATGRLHAAGLLGARAALSALTLTA
jgi:hypothetical protein